MINTHLENDKAVYHITTALLQQIYFLIGKINETEYVQNDELCGDQQAPLTFFMSVASLRL